MTNELTNITDEQLEKMITDAESYLAGHEEYLASAGPFDDERQEQRFLLTNDYLAGDVADRLDWLKAERERRRATQLTDAALTEKIVNEQCRLIELRRQYKDNPLAQPGPTPDQRRQQVTEWNEAIRRNLHPAIQAEVERRTT